MSDLKISTIQTNLYWEDKNKNIEHLNNLIDSIEETDIIILPEMFTTGFSMDSTKLAEKMDGKTVSWMKNQAKVKNAVVTGSLIVEEEGNYYNRLVWA